MSRKIDYHDDPAAPKPNGLVPAVTVVVVRDNGALLLIRRIDNGNGALPGGAIEVRESVVQAAVRETPPRGKSRWHVSRRLATHSLP